MRNPIGVVSCHLRFSRVEDAFLLASRHGLELIEWFEPTVPRFTEPDMAAQIRALVADTGIQASYHAPYLGEWSLGELEAAEAEARAIEMVRRAGRLGAQVLTVHLGRAAPKRTRAASVAVAGKAIAAAAHVAADLGICIGVENFTRSHHADDLGDSCEELAAVLDASPGTTVGWVLDTGHAAITRNTAELFARFGDRLVNAHIHDNDGASDAHLPPGAGVIDWPALVRAIGGTGRGCPLTLEFPESSGQYPAVCDWLRKANPDGGACTD